MSAFTHLQRFPSVYQYKTDASVWNLPSPSRIYIIPSVRTLHITLIRWKPPGRHLPDKKKNNYPISYCSFYHFNWNFFGSEWHTGKNNLVNYEYCTSQQGVFPCWDVRLSMHKTEPACWVQISAVFVVFIFAYLWEKH